MGGEIAALAREIYYNEKTFVIRRRSNSGDFVLPPKNVRPLVKQVKLSLRVDQWFWDFLVNFANKLPGFEHVRSLHIEVRLFEVHLCIVHLHTFGRWRGRHILEPVTISCGGQLSYVIDPTGWCLHENRHPVGYAKDLVGEAIKFTE
jgi:hypothetical protein